MSTRFAPVGLTGRMILIVGVTVMVPLSCCQVMVIVRGRTVVVIRVIMPEVFVDVQGRRHGRRPDQSLNKKECDEPAHERSVLRPVETLRKSSCVSRLGSGLVAIKPESAPSVREPGRRPPDCQGKGDHERQGQAPGLAGDTSSGREVFTAVDREEGLDKSASSKFPRFTVTRLNCRPEHILKCVPCSRAAITHAPVGEVHTSSGSQGGRDAHSRNPFVCICSFCLGCSRCAGAEFIVG
jgi:hypothetical protein